MAVEMVEEEMVEEEMVEISHFRSLHDVLFAACSCETRKHTCTILGTMYRSQGRLDD